MFCGCESRQQKTKEFYLYSSLLQENESCANTSARVDYPLNSGIYFVSRDVDYSYLPITSRLFFEFRVSIGRSTDFWGKGASRYPFS